MLNLGLPASMRRTSIPLDWLEALETHGVKGIEQVASATAGTNQNVIKKRELFISWDL
jgi:hypothetical protein